ncbi:unnamed protein product [Meganyctiphanes norvegica]|uniref:Sphingomyelin phosphodiesterase n=1 Tax=Meganyctiphanes norvegica TaxID=48144 RepID=A0AAV2RFW0_MEGNR
MGTLCIYWLVVIMAWTATCSPMSTSRNRLSRPASGPEDFLVMPSGMSGSLLCLECQTLLAALQQEVVVGVPYEDLVAEGIIGCAAATSMTLEYCQGYIPLVAPIVYHLLSNGTVDPKDACGEVLSSLGCTSDNPNRDWTVTIQGDKPEPMPITPPDVNSPVMKVLHFSDTHMDPYYQPGSNANCPEPLCCRNSSGPVENEGDGAWYWGDLRGCGTPPWLITNMLQHITNTHQDISYVIWTGDIVPHSMWLTSVESNLQIIKETYGIFRSFFPDTLFFPVVGNHEANPLDMFPAPGQAPSELATDWLYEELMRQWVDLLPADQVANSTILKGGYYSVLLKPGFRIITVNNLWGYSNNLWLVQDSQDPGDELTWLEDELNKAEEAGELVHLLGHIPPGLTLVEPTWTREYNRIINRYENTIRAQFFGHTHTDEFEVFYDGDRPMSVGYIAPSQTTWDYYNPGYRVYTVEDQHDETTWSIIDYENWIMNLTEAHEIGSPRWFELYSAKEEYNMEALQPTDWDDLATRMSTDRQLFDKYFKNYVKASEHFLTEGCDDLCYKERLCDMVTTDRNNMEKCNQLIGGMTV